jgi:hypothetical protein
MSNDSMGFPIKQISGGSTITANNTYIFELQSGNSNYKFDSNEVMHKYEGNAAYLQHKSGSDSNYTIVPLNVSYWKNK